MAGFWAKELHAEFGTLQGRGEKHGRGRARPGRPPGRSHRPMSRPSPIPIAPSSARPSRPAMERGHCPGAAAAGMRMDRRTDGQTDTRGRRGSAGQPPIPALPASSCVLPYQARPGCGGMRDAPWAGHGDIPDAPHLSQPAGRAGIIGEGGGGGRASLTAFTAHPPSPTPLTSGFARSCCPAPDIISPGGLPAPRR